MAKVQQGKQQQEELTITDLLSMALSYWKWFVLSVFLCLGVSFLYLKKTPKIYQRQANILIKDEKNGASINSESAIFNDIAMLGGNSNVNNEIEIFKSKRLMIEVVRRLRLDMDYYQKGKLSIASCYASSPVKLLFLDAKDEDVFSLVMNVKSDNEITLSSFETKDKIIDKVIKTSVGKIIETPFGRVQTLINNHKGGCYGHDIHVAKRDLEATGIAYSNNLKSVVLSKKTSIITLTLQDQSPERAEEVINTLIEVYNDDAVEDKNRVAIRTEEFINEQLKELEGDLFNVDSKISQYKSTHLLTNLESDAVAFRTQKNAQEQKVLELQNQKSVAQYILDYMNRNVNSFDVIPSNTGLNNSTVESLISQYNSQAMLRDKLILDAGESNPQVQDLTSSIIQLRQRVISSVHNLIQSLNIEMNNVSAYGTQATNRLTAVPGQQQTVMSVERQQKIKESLYLYLLNKRQENMLSKSIAASNARVIDPAMGSKLPVEPKSPMIILIGLSAGLLIPTIILWMLVTSNTKVRSRKDVEKVLSSKVVGEIPMVAEKSRFPILAKLRGIYDRKYNKKRQIRKIRKIVVSNESHDPVSESIRIMRANLNFMKASCGQGKVLMLTSYIPGSGKTFITGNLGMSLALSGKKVLLVDVDIRRCSLSNLVGKNLPGVTNYLGGYTDNVDELIVKTKYHDNLDILPAGISAPNPSELLELPAFDKMMEEIKKKYDYIILDSVPVNSVADAIIVNRAADLTLFVIRAGNIDRRILPDIEQFQVEGKLKNMCVVVNGVSEEHIYSRYYGYRGYGYY